MNFQPITAGNAFIRMLICGESGAGKTHLARTLNPSTSVVVLTESKALPLAGTGIGAEHVKTWTEFEAFLRLFDNQGRLYINGKRIKNLFLDSISELANTLQREIVTGYRPALIYGRSGGKSTKPAGVYEDTMTQEDYGLFERKLTNALNALCDMEINLFATIRTYDDPKRGKYGFDIQGRTRNSLGSHFDLIGYIRRDPSDETGRARLLDFTADYVTVAKGHMDLPLVIPADLKAMQQALFEAGRDHPPTS
jgi:energy-coupling factor transporter ATP-binding protein EcfA2